MKIVLVAGARPNFMKIAPIIRAIEKHNLKRGIATSSASKSELLAMTPKFKMTKSLRGVLSETKEQPRGNLEFLLVHTGQHYDSRMSKIFFKDLEIPQPDIYLGVGSGTHAEQTAKVMIKFEKALFKEKPDLVMVVGDVNSTLAAALCAVKLHIPLAHVEAGLRSYDRKMPEEINRVVVDVLSDYLFTPSQDADENLKKEGIPKEKIFLVGDVMVDTLLQFKVKSSKLKATKSLRARSLAGHCERKRSNLIEVRDCHGTSSLAMTSRRIATSSAKRADFLAMTPKLNLKTNGYALLTLHRPSNVDNKKNFLKILEAVKKISKKIPIVFPVHPRTKKNMEGFKLVVDCRRIHLIEPLGYLEFLKLMMESKFVMTDSGGMQEETTVLKIPCLTLRETTERPITIKEGTNILVGNDTKKIIREAEKILDGKGKKGTYPKLWDGKAAERIISVLSKK